MLDDERDPATLHAGGPGHAGERFAAESILGLQALGVEPIIIGGTALRMYGSPIASIDLDLVLPDEEWDRYDVYDFLDARTTAHRAAHADAYIEPHGLGETNRLWNDARGYRIDRLFEAAGTQLARAVLGGCEVQVLVPSPPALGFMKTKALCDRASIYRHLGDGRLMVRLFDEVAGAIKGIPPGFMRRKSGKDLADITYLTDELTTAEDIARVAAALDLTKPLSLRLDEVPDGVVQDGDSILERHGLQRRATQTLEQLQDAFKAI